MVHRRLWELSWTAFNCPSSPIGLWVLPNRWAECFRELQSPQISRFAPCSEIYPDIDGVDIRISSNNKNNKKAEARKLSSSLFGEALHPWSEYQHTKFSFNLGVCQTSFCLSSTGKVGLFLRLVWPRWWPSSQCSAHSSSSGCNARNGAVPDETGGGQSARRRRDPCQSSLLRRQPSSRPYSHHSSKLHREPSSHTRAWCFDDLLNFSHLCASRLDTVV